MEYDSISGDDMPPMQEGMDGPMDANIEAPKEEGKE